MNLLIWLPNGFSFKMLTFFPRTMKRFQSSKGKLPLCQIVKCSFKYIFTWKIIRWLAKNIKCTEKNILGPDWLALHTIYCFFSQDSHVLDNYFGNYLQKNFGLSSSSSMQIRKPNEQHFHRCDLAPNIHQKDQLKKSRLFTSDPSLINREMGIALIWLCLRITGVLLCASIPFNHRSPFPYLGSLII